MAAADLRREPPETARAAPATGESLEERNEKVKKKKKQ